MCIFLSLFCNSNIRRFNECWGFVFKALLVCFWRELMLFFFPFLCLWAETIENRGMCDSGLKRWLESLTLCISVEIHTCSFKCIFVVCVIITLITYDFKMIIKIILNSSVYIEIDFLIKKTFYVKLSCLFTLVYWLSFMFIMLLFPIVWGKWFLLLL